LKIFEKFSKNLAFFSLTLAFFQKFQNFFKYIVQIIILGIGWVSVEKYRYPEFQPIFTDTDTSSHH